LGDLIDQFLDGEFPRSLGDAAVFLNDTHDEFQMNIQANFE